MLFNRTKTVTLDPVLDKIVNRIAPGSSLRGALLYEGGLIVQGDAHGEPLRVVGGPLIIGNDARLTGVVEVQGDCYIFGVAGSPSVEGGDLDLQVHGTVHVTSSSRTYGSIAFEVLETYVGAMLNSRFRTLPAQQPRSDAPTAQEVSAGDAGENLAPPGAANA